MHKKHLVLFIFLVTGQNLFTQFGWCASDLVPADAHTMTTIRHFVGHNNPAESDEHMPFKKAVKEERGSIDFLRKYVTSGFLLEATPATYTTKDGDSMKAMVVKVAPPSAYRVAHKEVYRQRTFKALMEDIVDQNGRIPAVILHHLGALEEDAPDMLDELQTFPGIIAQVGEERGFCKNLFLWGIYTVGRSDLLDFYALAQHLVYRSIPRSVKEAESMENDFDSGHHR